MIKNKLIIFMILVLAMLSIGVASAEDSSSLNTTDTVDEVVTLESDDVVLDDDSSQLQSDEVKSSNLNNEEDSDIVGLSSSLEDNELNESQTNNRDVLEYEGDVVIGQSITQEPTLGTSYHVSGNTFANLQTAINNAKAGDTLFLDGKTFTGSGTQITINKNLNIYGGSSTTDTKMATLNGNSKSRIMYIEGSSSTITVTLKGLNIKNGLVVSENTMLASALYVKNSILTFSDSIVSDCKAESSVTNHGGAVRIYNSEYLIKNVMFKNIGTRYYGSAGFISGVVLKIDGKLGTIDGCTFINCAGVNETGGIASGDGIIQTSGSNKIINCLFEDNAIAGGMICMLDNNTVVEDSTFINNYAHVAGGVIMHNGGSIINCTFRNNSANSDGGAIWLHPGDSTANVIDCKFYNNNATACGGAIYTPANSKCFIKNSIFENNTADIGGGAYIQGDYVVIDNCTFQVNSAVNGSGVYLLGNGASVSGSSFTNNHAIGYGGAVYVEGNNTKISNSNFTMNNASTGGAAINVAGDLTLTGSIFKNNTAGLDNAINYASGTYSASGNSFDHVDGKANIYNTGTFPEVQVKVLDGKTLNTSYGAIAKVYADVTDLEGATLSGGNFYFTINGTKYYASSAEGHYELNYPVDFVNTTKGVSATYENAEKQSLTKGYIYSTRASMTPTVNVTNTTHGDTTKVNVKVPTSGEGNVPTGTITISGDLSGTHTLTNGEYTFDYNTFPAGDYNITVTYSGDGYYSNMTVNKVFTISKAKQDVNIITNNIIYGDVEYVTISIDRRGSGIVPTGWVLVSGAGKSQNITLTDDGIAYLSIYDLEVKTYTLSVSYSGDSNYVGNIGQSSFNVDKASSKVDISVNNIDYGEDAIIYVNVTSGATGNVTVTVNNKEYTVKLINSKGSLTVENLTVKNYEVVAKYNGDSNYIASQENSASFDVNKIDPSIEIKVLGDVQDNHNITIVVVVPDDAEGTVNLTISGETDSKTINNVKVENGIAKFVIDELEYGDYKVVANYSGDDNYNAANSNSLAFVPKLIDYSMNITVNPTNPLLGDDVNIKVDLPKNATGEVIITVNDDEYTLNLTDGSANVTVTNVVAGKYNIKAHYNGDNQYASKNNSTSFTVSKENANLNVEVGEVVIGQPTDVTVTLTGIDNVPLNATVTVQIGDYGYFVNVEDGKGVIEDVVFDSTGKNAVVAKWDGNDDYNQAFYLGFFEVSHITDYDMTVSVDPINVGENATVKIELPEDATGRVIVEVEGKYYIGNVTGGVATITVPGLTNGTHELTVTYDGDSNYASKNKAVDVVVSKISGYPMSITVPSDVKVGENATIKVNLPTDATGIVNLTVGGKTYTTNVIIDGVATFNVPDLTNGTHDIKAEYFGDGKYEQNTREDKITISKVEGYPITVIVPEDVEDGENTTIIVKLPDDATGEVNITIGNETFTGEVENGTAKVNITGLPAGDHNITVNYTGDDKYAPGNTNDTITISKIADYNMSITADDVKVGEAALIKVNLPTDATGNVTVNIGGVDYNASLTIYGWIAVINNLTAGKHNIIANYSGNDKYAPGMATGSITVSKISEHDIDEYSIKIDTPEDVKVGDIAVINITLPSDINGLITVKIGNKTQYVPVTNGKASVTTDEFTLEGDYPITVTYDGNDKYTNNTGKASLIVSKISDYPIIIDVPTDIKSGDRATINVTLPEDINDNITIKVGDKEYNATVTNGKASITTDEFTGGKYTVNVTYVGNNKYAYNSNTTGIIFKKTDYDMNVTVIPEDLRTGENATIKVDLPDDATGNVTVTVDGKDYTVPVNNGTAEVTLPVLPEGEYNVTVDYPGDENYADKSENTTIISKGDYDWEVIIPEVTDDKNATITVIVPEDATGNVTVTVDGKDYTAPVNNGTAEITLPVLPAGKYDVTTTYNGDENYAPKTNTTSIISKKTNYDINVAVVDPEKIGGNGTVIVDVPGDGNITITIDGNKTIVVNVTNGTNNITLPVLPEGEHNITINYTSDEYADKTKNATITSKGDYDWEVIIPEVRDDKNATITVIVPKDATGNVTVTVDGKDYTAPVNNGTANVTLPVLPAGKYNVTTTYNGDDKYAPKTNTTSIVSKKTDYDMNVTVINPDKFGENATVIVDVPDDATGNVTVTIDENTTIVVPVENGTAVIVLPVLPEGEHNITVNFTDDKYADKSENATVISKGDYDWEVIIPEVRDDQNATITVIVPKDATGNVTVTVDGKDYTVPVNNGTAEVILPVLPAGKYDVITTYNGDENYAPKTNNTSIISKKTDYSINTTIPDELKPDVPTPFNVTIPDGGNGTVIIIIGNKTIPVNITNGTGNGTLPPLGPGDHDIVINYTGDDTHVPTSTNKTVKVVSNDVNLTAKDVVMIYKDGSRLYAVLLDAYGKPIANTTLSFTINGVTYTRTTNVNGTASLAINLDYGIYPVVISYAGNATYNSASVNATVTVESSIIGNDLVKMWRNGTQFYATFLGQGAKPLANTNVTFNINGVLYTRQTNANGTAKLNINLDPSNYTLTAYNPYSGEQRGFNVLVKPLIDTSDLTKYYINGSKFEAKVWNYDGSLAANTNVTFNINGVFYTRTADENGIVRLSITLRPGDYIITSMYEGLSIGNKVKVLPTLETSDFSMKYNDGSTFKVKTLDGQGNPLSNQNITFNVNGVFYHKTTGDDGVASLNINLMKGEYIITSYWRDFETGNKISIS